MKFCTKLLCPIQYLLIIKFIFSFSVVEGPVLRDRKISVREKINSLGPWIEDRLDRGCSRKQITKRLPITQWLPKYSLEDGTGDLVAGVTVGMTVVLQAIAYSNIAGLDPQVGIIRKKMKKTKKVSGSEALDS